MLVGTHTQITLVQYNMCSCLSVCLSVCRTRQMITVFPVICRQHYCNVSYCTGTQATV